MSAPPVYVLGFLFDVAGDHVLLADRTGPPIGPRGLYGLGGRAKPSEDRLEAMRRVAKDQVKVDAAWEYACSVNFDGNAAVHLYRAFDEAVQRIDLPKDVEIFAIGNLSKPKFTLAPGLRWMIEVARDRSVYAGALVTR